MRKSLMQKLAIACIAAFAVLGGIGATNAQMHGGGGHGGGGFHGGGFHDHSHRSFFIGAPIVFGPGYYPYDYSYPYGYSYPYESQDSGANYWYCPNPAGYYPNVQTCPSGWLQVVPNSWPNPCATRCGLPHVGEWFVPGGSIAALLLWTYRHRTAPRPTAIRSPEPNALRHPGAH